MGILEDQLKLLTENNAGIPTSSLAAMARVNEGAANRGTNTFASTSPTGEITITGGAGVETPANVLVSKPATSALASKLSSSQEVDPIANTVSMMKSIQEETDPTKKMELLSAFSATLDGHVASATGELSKISEGMFSVPQLEQELQQSIAIDQSSGFTARYGTDSAETETIRNSLSAARLQAANHLSTLIATNPSIQTIENLNKNFVNTQLQLAGHELSKKEAQGEKDQSLLDAVGVARINLAKLVEPSLKTDVAAATFAYKQPKTGEFTKLADYVDAGDTTALVNMAADSRNTKAPEVVASLQASAVTGKTEGADYEVVKRQASKDIKFMRESLTTPEVQDKMLKLAFPTVAEKTAWETKMKTAMLDAATPKEQLEIKQKFLAQAAQTALSNKKTVDFTSDISTWNPGVVQSMQNSGKLKDIISSIPAGTTVSLPILVGKIMTIQDNVQRMQAMDELKMYTRSAVSYENTGFLGTVNSSLVESQLNQEQTRSILKTMTRTAEGLVGGVNPLGYLMNKGQF